VDHNDREPRDQILKPLAFRRHNAKAHAPRSAGAGDGLGVGVMAWGRHGNWAADRGCHAATCSAVIWIAGA
jgi:hypothetical protein